MQRARFITVEGIDGAGKSTQLETLADWFSAHGIQAVFTREPGGTPLGEALRDMLLKNSSKITLETETLLMFASRQQLLTDVIRPALDAGYWVVSDRFTDATYAYQGGGRGVPEDKIHQLEQWVQQGLQPDMTLLFDIVPGLARQRRVQAQPSECLDRFEQESLAFHERVRESYLTRARAYTRFCVIDASQAKDIVTREVKLALQRLIETK